MVLDKRYCVLGCRVWWVVVVVDLGVFFCGVIVLDFLVELGVFNFLELCGFF